MDECSAYYVIPNVTNEIKLTFNNNSNHDPTWEIQATIHVGDSSDDTMYFPVHRTRNKHVEFIITYPSIRTRKSREEVSIWEEASASSIGDNVIKSDAEAVDKIERRTIDAVTSTTRIGAVFDRISSEDLSCAIEDFVREVPLRYAKDAARYAEDVVSNCISSIEIESDIADGETSGSETSIDAFAEAREKKRRAYFILERVAKVSDAPTTRLLPGAEIEEVDFCARGSVTSTTDETEGEMSRSTKPLVSSPIIYANEKSSAITTTTMTVATTTEDVMQQMALADTESREYCAFSDASDETFDTAIAEIIPIEKIRRDGNIVSDTVPFTKTHDSADTALAAVVTNENKKVVKQEGEKESSNKVYPRLMVNRSVSIVNKTVDAAVGSSIIDLVREPTEDTPKSLEPSRSKNTRTDGPSSTRAEIVFLIDDIIDSFVEILPRGETAQIAKNVCQESARPKYRKYRTSKYRNANVSNLSCDISDDIDESVNFNANEVRLACFKKTQIAKNIEKTKIFPITSSEATKEFHYWFERPTARINRDDRGKSASKILQPIRYCEDLIPNNIHLDDFQYSDTAHFNLQNESIRNATFNHICYSLPQDSCVLCKYRRAFPRCSPIISNAICSNCDTDNCTKRGAMFENSLHSNTYCNCGVKYCYSHLNNIDSVRMNHCRCNDDFAVWNDDRHYGRNQSHYWADGNLYFMQRWMSSHLLRYN